MDAQSIIGELLYIGIVAEKSRCYGTKWQLGYKRTLKKHIITLNEVQKCLLSTDENVFYTTINNFITVCNENRLN